MPARRSLIRPVPLMLKLPEDLRARLDLHLWSDLEGRVPKGSYQRLFVKLLTQYFQEQSNAVNPRTSE